MGKGGDFERHISKTLTRWLSGQEKPYLYWRMPGSGGLATIHEENRGLSGDIRALSPDAEFLTDCFSIECKTGYPRSSFWQHFKDLKNNHIKEFWKQAVHDAYNAEKRPMLIYRKKGQQIIIGICKADKLALEIVNDILPTLPCIEMRFRLEELPPVVFFDFKEFFDTIRPIEIEDGL